MITRILFALCLVLAVPACGDDDSNAGQDGSTGQDASGQHDGAAQQDGATQADAQTQHDAAVAQDFWIGATCTCTGSECEQMGVPRPNMGTIAGCENVPLPWTGAELVCLRSYTGAFATDTYFANGYCSLMATTCVGDGTICGSAVWGDFAAMVSCPPGSVMIQDSQDVNVFGMTATIENKTCAPACNTSADCREGETDSVFGDEATQYQCVDNAGTKFCYDPRNLGANYTVTPF